LLSKSRPIWRSIDGSWSASILTIHFYRMALFGLTFLHFILLFGLGNLDSLFTLCILVLFHNLKKKHRLKFRNLIFVNVELELRHDSRLVGILWLLLAPDLFAVQAMSFPPSLVSMPWLLLLPEVYHL
jgi:hypothetical protein